MKKILSFILILLFVAGCAKKTENEYMNLANDSWKKNDIPEAIKSYESLVKEYPNGAMASKALMELGKLYQYKIDKRLNERESLDKAVECFKSLFEKYPQSQEAPLALFMVGFIQANELKQYPKLQSITSCLLKNFLIIQWFKTLKMN